MRGNDPVFVFGSRLRQQNFTRADLALSQLNTPTPISNFSTRFSGQWNRFDGACAAVTGWGVGLRVSS
jgi:hypothetical protein